MTKSHYPYPPDEFDVRGPDGAPVGVHREPRSGWSSVWPFLLVAVVFAGLGVGIISFLSDDGDTGTANPPAASEQSAEPDSSASAEDDAASEEPSDGESADDESTDGEPSEDASEEPSDEPAPEPDLAVSVRVLNASGAPGVAGSGADVLGGEGFTDVSPEDYPEGQTPPDVDTIWYATAEDEDTALAIADAFGIDTENVQEVAVSTGDVLVILHEAPEA